MGHRSRSVVVVPTVAGVGGSTRVVTDLAAGLRAAGVETRLVFPDPDSPETEAAMAWLANEGVQAEASEAVPAWYGGHGPRAMWRLWKFFRSTGAATVYLHYGSNQISPRDVLCSRLALRRTVVMVHHAVPIPSRTRRAMTAAGAWLANAVVVSTPVMAELLQRYHGPRKKVVVVPLASRPPERRLTKREARKELGIAEEDFVIALLARLDPGKNAPALMELVAGLREQGLRVSVVVAGKGEDLERCRALAARPNSGAHVLGFVPDAAPVLASADVFSMPSREEGFGLVFLEAAWFGLPSVAFDVGGVRYAIKNGVTGFTRSYGDWDGLKEDLSRLYASPELVRNLGESARERVEAEFSVARFIDRHRPVLGV